MASAFLGMRVLRAGTAAVGLLACAGQASAGGFANGEQSTVFLGSARAGAAAGGSLGSMYWNPAATAALPGMNSESSYTLILPNGEVTVTGVNGGPFPPSSSGEIGIDALVSGSYGSYQLSENAWVGVAVNSPFGLATKPENNNYFGSVLGRTTKLLTMNVNPTLAYKVAPGITIGGGAQIEYARGKFSFATGSPVGPSTIFKGDDYAFGATAGILVEPAAGTSIGLGWRSALSHELDGHFSSFSPLGPFTVGAKADVDLPDIVSLSFRQALAPNMRLMGTVEWTNWSRFQDLTVHLAPAGTLSLPANWVDGWFYSIGGEFDYSPDLTLRAGVAYETSPVDAPSKRFTSIPDNDRVWLSLGGSYKYSEATTIDFGYSHLFVKDSEFARSPVGSPIVISGTVDASVDLVSLGVRTRW